jgi:polygalacturonase
MKANLLARRKFLKTAAQGALAAPLLSPLSALASAQGPQKLATSATPQHADSIAAAAPKAKVTLNVRDFGATGEGLYKDTVAIQQTIDRCAVLGGGEVLVPAGNYFTGALMLRSNTLLRLDKDASIVGTPDFADYPVTQVRWEGHWIQGHTGLISAIDAAHLGIVGPGKIVGNPALSGRPTKDSPLRHPCLIEFTNCTDVRLEDFSTSMHVMWSIHPTYCENVSIKNLTIRSTGGNGDGIDIDSCKHVLIDGCDISTGDDCISLKSGRGEEAYSIFRPTEDVRITNCTFADAIFACIGIGSETSGGIRGVHIEHCKFTAAKTFAIYIKSRPGRGAFIEDIFADDLDVSGMTGGFLRFNILNSGIQDESPVPGDEGIPTIANFRFSNIRVTDVPVLVDGAAIHPHKPLDGLTLSNVTGTCAKGIFLANIKHAVISNIKVTGFTGPLLNVSNVTGTGLAGAAKLDAAKLPDPIPAPETPYQLH